MNVYEVDYKYTYEDAEGQCDLDGSDAVVADNAEKAIAKVKKRILRRKKNSAFVLESVARKCVVDY